MANKGYVEQILNGLPRELKGPLFRVFEHVLDNLRFGMQTNERRAENFQGYRFDATTHAVADTEFSVPHGLGYTPTLWIPIGVFDVGASVVPLTVTRAADEQRMYFRSSSTSAPVSLYVE